MPFSRGKKPTTSKIPKLGARSSENQADISQAKRSSSPPQGAPRKRTAFIDITNAHKLELSNPIKKKDLIKKVQKKTSVAAKNEANLKKSASVSSEDKPVVAESEVSLAEKPEEPVSGPPFLPRLLPPEIPPEFDIDSDTSNDCTYTPEYAKDIFDYLKNREEKHVLHDYMGSQAGLNQNMRAVLVDWLVEVQENFELNHETLYLAVKITDHYLAVVQASRESLQLIGSTAMLLACKFEERLPPCVDDFLYICDDAYKRSQLIAMEMSILHALSFDINIPVAYRFLRRYAKDCCAFVSCVQCVNAGMDTLTLARFVCELSLMDMCFVPVRGSLLASACLLIALVTKDLGGWSECLQFHSGYRAEDLGPVARHLHRMLSSTPDAKLATIRSKYSHKVFFEVALIPTLSLDKLETFLK
ncbi:G2/mitotic-specific cyclin-B3 isoform X1 [Electrophorus electricus]|uniref:G2/mitotic-specific cyclin-B3 isoform X1 n=1 Tax=Electrophorus electricus TaxID=8005 RepID=UPI0015D01821|nr:G2/mitotic-specific cyclin-B3 isoform X1 [Electrophorus electricus]XP_026882254.2 G2/mitotic-specific cyclin-B3 isoform X1 [Electrophorus electricus]XP_035375959.1 G2/mitotic-specific cyclin-B3 isoform X1 [Electrophorus electricus]